MRHKIGLYIRVSTDEQAQVIEGSLPSQKHRLTSFVDIKNVQEAGWGKIIDTYVDEGLSGKDTRRPAFQRMMSDIRKGKINLILVTDLSRLSRNILDFCFLLEDLRKVNAKFLSMKEQFDTSTPAGEMMVFNMINLAQFERKQTSERVSLNFHSRALRGLSNGGPVPMGYDKDPQNPSTYVVDEVEASNVRTIFKIFLEERTCRQTIPRLIEEGIKPKEREKRNYRLVTLGQWSPKTILRILRNVAYIGLREINLRNKGADPLSLKPSETYQVVKASWPAIIDREDFDEVQKILDESELFQRCRLKGQERRIFFLSGLMKCAQCGGPIVGSAAHGKNQVHRYYVHRKLVGEPVKCQIKRFRADDVEDAIIRHLEIIMQRQGYLDGLNEIFEEKYSSQNVELKRKRSLLEGNLHDLSNEINHIVKLHLDLGQSAGVELIKEKLSKLSEKRIDLKKQLEEITFQLESTPDPVEACREVQQNLELFQRGWKKSTPFQKKSLLRLVFNSLVVAPEEIGAFFNVTSDQPSEENGSNPQFPSDSGVKESTSLLNFPIYGVPFPSQSTFGGKGSIGSHVKTSGASEENRTPTPVKVLDFESSASTSSATEAFVKVTKKTILVLQNCQSPRPVAGTFFGN
jgi:site-specific DNA recombinase